MSDTPLMDALDGQEPVPADWKEQIAGILRSPAFRPVLQLLHEEIQGKQQQVLRNPMRTDAEVCEVRHARGMLAGFMRAWELLERQE